MGTIALYAGLIALSTFIVIAWSRNAEPARAMTMTFMALGFAQLFHLGNARSRGPVVGRRAATNVPAIAALVIVTILQVAAVHLAPLARVLHAVPLDVADWMIVIGAALIPATAGQVLKLMKRARPIEDAASA
jgi:Ca2+-transporting ATPase